MAGLERYWDSAWKWRRSLVEVFEQKLGTPACAPSGFTMQRYCATVAPLPGCGPSDYQTIERLFRWVWRNGGTETLIVGGASPELFYSDITAWGVVERARKRASTAYEERKARAKEAELTKITGGSPVPGESDTATGALSSSADEIAEEVKPLECFKDEEELTVDVHTSSDSWSNFGIGSFRWGMGPGDAKETLLPNKAAKAIWDPGGLGFPSIVVPDQALGTEVTTRLLFPKGRLQTVSYSLFCSDLGSAPLQKCVDWFHKVHADLGRRHGKSRCTLDGKYTECRWRGSSAEWPSITRYDGGRFQTINVSFRNPEDRPIPLDASAMRAGTLDSTWSKQGWNGFMWGMGPANVRRRLETRKEEFHPTRELACAQDREAKGGFECLLERDFHKFAVAGLRPNLTFRFKYGRLNGISLSFPKHMERQEFAVSSKKLRDLLVARYGKPAEPQSSSEHEEPPSWMQWTLEDERVWYGAIMGDESDLSVSYSSSRRSVVDATGETSKL
jgi:hypothetical protein